MSAADVVSVGIDSTSGHKGFTYAALDRDLRLVTLAEGEIDEVLEFIGGRTSALVGINSPSHVNAGVVRKRLESTKGSDHSLRGAELRLAELELHSRGIAISATPRNEALCPSWVQLGFVFYARLIDQGFKAYPQSGAARQWLETHPHASFCVLLGRAPLPKPTLEGRLQRALALFERGVRIPDPMAFLEEITRHRLLNGLLPTELVLAPEQLDALSAAYTAWLAAFKPHELSQVGNKQEGFITLPGPELKEKY
jgi:uncharacterized protein DUF429